MLLNPHSVRSNPFRQPRQWDIRSAVVPWTCSPTHITGEWLPSLRAGSIGSLFSELGKLMPISSPCGVQSQIWCIRKRIPIHGSCDNNQNVDDDTDARTPQRQAKWEKRERKQGAMYVANRLPPLNQLSRETVRYGEQQHSTVKRDTA